MYFLEAGLDLVRLVQGILRSAVMEGIHPIDVSLIIAPVIHEYIKGFTDAAEYSMMKALKINGINKHCLTEEMQPQLKNDEAAR